MTRTTSSVVASALLVPICLFVLGCSGASEVKTPSSDKVEFPPLPTAVSSAEMAMVDGTKFTIGDRKGKVVLLNLWATWCGPCIEEMPDLIKMQNELGPKGFEVLGLNTEMDPDADFAATDRMIKGFIAEQGLNYPNAYITGEVQNELVKISNLAAIPQSFLVDREGRLRAVFTGGGKKTIDKIWESVRKVTAE